MNSGELSQFTNHWYVTAGDGDVVVRVFPGMWLGETETGELSVDGNDALLSLSIGSDESLVVFALNGGVLDAEDGEFSGRRHLAFDSAAQIRLPNNNLRLDKDILSEGRTDAQLLPQAVWRAASADDDNQTPATDSVDTAQPPSLSELATSNLSTSNLSTSEPDTPEPSEAETSATEPNEPQSIAVATEQPIPQTVRDTTPNSHIIRRRPIAAAASAAFVFVLIGLVYAKLQAPVTPDTPAQVTRQIPTETETETEAPTVALPDLDQIADRSESAPDSLATSVTPAIAKPVITPPITPQIELDALPTPAVAATTPLSQNRPTPDVVTQAAPTIPAATPQNAGSQPTNPTRARRREVAETDTARTAALVETRAEARAEAEAQAQREQDQAQTAQVTYERDLLAAELALAQGRLTEPPADNAYTLYKQLVASNPESSEARRGFQALGAALVNRAFAELAARRWGEARATLAAAAEAGASPNLVADLSGEVDYQQRLADAEAGRFNTLYPEGELVALNRTTPRLRRFASDGIDQVQIEFTISVAGTVQDIEVLGAPPQRLERIVREAVTDWRFEPVLSGTRPIPVRTRVGLDIP